MYGLTGDVTGTGRSQKSNRICDVFGTAESIQWDVGHHGITLIISQLTGHISIGDGSVIAAQAGVMKDVPPGVTVSGYPAREHQHSLRVNAAVVQLPEFRRLVMEFMRNFRTEEEDDK